MRAATGAALGGAAAHAKLLADQEHREMEYLVSTLIDTQVSKSGISNTWYIYLANFLSVLFLFSFLSYLAIAQEVAAQS